MIGQRALEGNEYTKWGHEYLQQLSSDLSSEYEKRLLENKSADDILNITEKIVRHFANHNSEMEAIDLLMEIDKIERVVEFISKDNYKKVYDYLVSSSHYTADTEEWTKF